MNKPRAFVHFEQTYDHDEMGVLAIGKVHIPTVVVIVFVLLVAGALTVVSGVAVGMTGNSGMWMILGWYGIIVGSSCVIGGLTSLLAWMGRVTIAANRGR